MSRKQSRDLLISAVMKRAGIYPVILLMPYLAFSQSSPDAIEPVFRDPFTLRLMIDSAHYYEEHFERKIPYVANNEVYLFSGENFGINLKVVNDEIVAVIYQPDLAKADVRFKFWQEKKLGSGMMLVIENKTKKKLFMDSLMTIPKNKGIHKTSIIPIDAGLTDYESWPHPIVQLVLRSFRFTDKAPENKP